MFSNWRVSPSAILLSCLGCLVTHMSCDEKADNFVIFRCNKMVGYVSIENIIALDCHLRSLMLCFADSTSSKY